ncbi:MAG TPA: hypothetical protein ENG47_06485 [Candidatus Aerophobetes bacterium]|uniref:Uncharacterized protein n=1 Tax=Aerophobetes bacterium TaxID=2030807 RepID=A0A7V0QSF3_UNCAE|nr:hypothetical protein [Candidatus Aerophobetes bacterium]
MKVKNWVLILGIMMLGMAKLYAFEPSAQPASPVLPPDGNIGLERAYPVFPEGESTIPAKPIVVETYRIQLIDPKTGEVIGEKTITAIDVNADGVPDEIVENDGKDEKGDSKEGKGKEGKKKGGGEDEE